MTLSPHMSGRGDDSHSHQATASPPDWEGLSARVTEAKDAPAVNPASAAAPEAGRDADLDEPASPPAAPPRRSARPVIAAAALVLSASLHAAALAFFLDRLSRAGVEAETDAVSVEIVLEAPPEPRVAAAGSLEPTSAIERKSEESRAVEAPPEPAEAAKIPADLLQPSAPPEAAETAEAEAVPAAENRATAEEPEVALETPPSAALPQSPETPAKPVEEPAQPATHIEQAEPVSETAEMPSEDAAEFPPLPAVVAVAPSAKPTAQPVPDFPGNDGSPSKPDAPEAWPARAEPKFAEAVTPVADAPLPSPRPSYEPSPKAPSAPKGKAKKVETAKAAPATRNTGKKQETGTPARTAKAETRRKTEASAAGSASARGGASAGSAAKYGQKLLAHVERHKRYPDAAARQRITGATRLTITIDRAGRLAGARVAGGSGHVVLDQAAIEAARRAAPYPRPPDGVGGGTFSFAVTMRFSR